MSNPKILTLDLETAPMEVSAWGLWDQNIGLDMVMSDWSILSFCAKWLGSNKLIYADTSGRGAANVRDDSPILTMLWELLDEADIVVAQNGMKFDIKKVNSRFLEKGYKPYSPIRVVDTLVVARKYFGFSSNKLAWLSEKLTDTPKSAHKKFPGFELWSECLKDNADAWKEMRKYNQRDVVATEKLYLTLRPWIVNHPNVGAYAEDEFPICPKCGCAELQRRGHSLTQNGKYQRFQCNGCGGWSRAKQTDFSVEKRKTLLV